MGALTSVPVGRLIKHQHCILHLQSKQRVCFIKEFNKRYKTVKMGGGAGSLPYRRNYLKIQILGKKGVPVVAQQIWIGLGTMKFGVRFLASISG